MAEPPVTTDVLASLKRLWRLFRKRQLPVYARMDPTTLAQPCVPRECNFLVSDCRTWAVCLSHSLVHYCTEETCKWWVVREEARVCVATATCYPLNPEDALNWSDVLTREHASCFAADNPFSKEYQDPIDLIVEDTPKVNKRKQHPPTIGILPVYKTIRRRSAFTQSLDRHTLHPEQWTEERIQKLSQEAFDIVFSLLGSPERAKLDADIRDTSTKHLKYRFHTYMDKRRKAGKPVFFIVLMGYVLEDQAELEEQLALQQIPLERIRALCSMYAQRAVEYYARVSDRTTMDKYQFRYHVLACCYTWSCGIKDQATWLLEPDDALRRMLPKDKHVQKLDYISRTFTRHWKELRKVLVKLSHQGQIFPSYSQAPLPRSRSAQY